MQFQKIKNCIFIILKYIVSFLLPPRCFVSAEPVDAPGLLAPAIWQKLCFVSKPYCFSCGIPFDVDVGEETLCVDCLERKPAFVSARSPLVYDDASKQIVLAFKHHDKIEAVVSMAPLMISVMDDLQAQFDAIIPVPLHRKRLFSRRYNQSALLAQAIGRRRKLPVYVDCLIRTENTLSQGGKKREERFQNVKGVFAVRSHKKNDIKNKAILLIDDVMTTGATLDACASVLMNEGALAVYALCFARVPKRFSQGQDLFA